MQIISLKVLTCLAGEVLVFLGSLCNSQSVHVCKYHEAREYPSPQEIAAQAHLCYYVFGHLLIKRNSFQMKVWPLIDACFNFLCNQNL